MTDEIARSNQKNLILLIKEKNINNVWCLLLDLGSPEGIALDHLGRNIFWTDSQLDRIEVAKLDGTQRRVLFETDLVNPRGIVTDSVRGCVHAKSLQSCPTLCDPVDYSPPGCSVLGILQARILGWVALLQRILPPGKPP